MTSVLDRLARLAAGFVLVLALIACETAVHAQPRMTQPVTDSAFAGLARIPVKGRAPKTGYSRAQFGAAWADTDHDGCDQRNQVLARDLTDVRFKPGTHGCVVLRGHLTDPYTGASITFARGPKTSMVVQIDHVVSAPVTPLGAFPLIKLWAA